MSDDDEELASGASEEECVVSAADPAGTPEDWSPFQAEYDGTELPPVPKVMGSDGLPHVHAPEETSDIPKLSEATLVCMGVYTKFVIRDPWRDVLAQFEPTEVQRAPDGRYRVARKLTEERLALPEQTSFEALAESLGWVKPFDYDANWVCVEPIRPMCRHYVRQRSQMDLNPSHRDHYRLCALRRTTEGAMMSLKDRGMWACDARDPRDPESETLLDDFDRLKMLQGKHRTFLSIFNVAPPEADTLGSAFEQQPGADE